jgi:hypothetical protein
MYKHFISLSDGDVLLTPNVPNGITGYDDDFISLPVFYLFTCVLSLFKNLFIYLFTSIIYLFIYLHKVFKALVNLQACYLLYISSILFIYHHSFYLQVFYLSPGILFTQQSVLSCK